jgi:hypothetical protein
VKKIHKKARTDFHQSSWENVPKALPFASSSFPSSTFIYENPEVHDMPTFVSDAAGGLNSDKWASMVSLGVTETGKGVCFLARGI